MRHASWFRVGLLVALCVVVGSFVVAVGPTAAATSFGHEGEVKGEAESIHGPGGIAVDANGDVYVGDGGNNRLDKFDGAGGWQWAAGVGVFDNAPQMETCTTSCLGGEQVGSAEALQGVTGVAVDTDPLSSSYGDVYVVDDGHSRVEKFGPEGKFILMFGGKVNAETSPANPDVCAASEKCNLYASTGVEDGEFSEMLIYGSSSYIAVGPRGAVYVGDKARVEVFEPTGAWKENISLSGLSSSGHPSALAMDGNGDVFVNDAGVAGVREFLPPSPPTTTVWSEASVRFDETSSTVTALAVDSAGHVFVGDSSGGFHVLEYDAGGKALESFATSTVQGENRGLAFSAATGEVYASDYRPPPVPGARSQSYIWVVPVPSAGPIVDSQSATPELRGAATFESRVNPEGSETTVHFEYVTEAQFEAGGYAGATSTTPVSIGAGFEDQGVSVHPSLTPGTVYHYRVVAVSSQATTTGGDESFQETPPAQITGPSATDVSGTSVTLNAGIDPLGASTTYRLEYGTSTAYGHAFAGTVGEGMSEVVVSHHFQGLEPGSEYHYRVTTGSEVGAWQSSDHTFTTQGVGEELALPDGRVWELVSPADKHGAVIRLETGETAAEAAAEGTGVAYGVTSPVSEVATGSKVTFQQALSTREPGGWRTQEVETAQKLLNTEYVGGIGPETYGTYAEVFSTDLSQVLVEPYVQDVEPLSSDATERTLYLRDNATGKYLPLVTPANVPAGVKFGGEAVEVGGCTGDCYSGTEQEMRFVSATPDLSHVVFRSPLRLTSDAVEGPGYCGFGIHKLCPMNLYEWSGGRLSLVDVLPNGEPLVGERGDGAYLGRAGVGTRGAVSDDGRWVVWSHGSAESQYSYPLYVRDMVSEKTWKIGGIRPLFEMMSANGAWVFYWEGHELYAYDVSTHTATDITVGHGPGEHNAGVKDGLDMNVSRDGTYVYYAATGILAPGAVDGEDNLYVSHYDGASWGAPTLIATLSKADEPRDLIDSEDRTIVHWQLNYARVSPDGRYLAFMSSRSLTGYDNTDLSEQETADAIDERGTVVKTRVHHDEEVFLYHALTGRLACASCNPTGMRPTGFYLGSIVPPKIAESGDWFGRWLAATLPKWSGPEGRAAYQPRYLSDSGRVFFNSVDALVPQDTNGLADVYEYEPSGVGTCTDASVTFSARSSGCTSLVSAGTSGEESAFVDASEKGDDVFFDTSSKLVPEDYDTANDVYDAHVCSAGVPCHVVPVTPPACTSGDSCKPAPAPQPEIFGPAPSATFSGVGNFSEPPRALMKRSHKPKRHAKARKRRKAKHGRKSRHGKGRASAVRAHRARAVTGRGK